jgi:hypothetical protein
LKAYGIASLTAKDGRLHSIMIIMWEEWDHEMPKHLANLFADSLVQDPIGAHHNLDFIDDSYRFIDS